MTDPRDDFPTALTYLTTLQEMQARGISETTLRRRLRTWGIERARGADAVDGARQHALKLSPTIAESVRLIQQRPESLARPDLLAHDVLTTAAPGVKQAFKVAAAQLDPKIAAAALAGKFAIDLAEELALYGPTDLITDLDYVPLLTAMGLPEVWAQAGDRMRVWDAMYHLLKSIRNNWVYRPSSPDI
ncbi:hypothetical protein [Deinococcus marmoris]|uniref:hypothetical protein n=1 Tax=Deinococcus marmoris TaxID=249408 RepID=UPI000496B235|nr:hypothetical protein [Deinococcus marmoris]